MRDDANSVLSKFRQGDADAFEILFRTPQAPVTLQKAKARHPHCVFGAGTMLHAGHVETAVAVGAKAVSGGGSKVGSPTVGCTVADGTRVEVG